MRRYFRNERGNTTIFIMGALGIMALMFTIIGSFANVFITKEKASNNAEQASMVASGEILKGLEQAIVDYDAYQLDYYTRTERLDLYYANSILRKLSTAKMSFSGQDYSQIEIDHLASNAVIKEELPISLHGMLETYVKSEYSSALGRVRTAVERNIKDNKGELTGTVVTVFNDNKRVEVRTSTLYKALKYDHLYPDDKRKVEQKGEGLKFDFFNSNDGFFRRQIHFP